MSLVRKPAPYFQAIAWYKGDFHTLRLSDYEGKYLVLFFYPLNFTFVCPTQIISFSNKAIQFRELGCQVIACSVDSKFSHMEYTLKSRQEGGLGEIDIPLLSDINQTISRSYRCLIDQAQDSGLTFRATYIIDSKGIVRHQSVNDLNVGRNPQQFLRLVKALMFVDQTGQQCRKITHPGHNHSIAEPRKKKQSALQLDI